MRLSPGTRRLCLTICGVVLGACATDRITSGDLEGFPLQLSSTDIWQGSETIITSPMLAGFDSLLVLIDGDSLAPSGLRRVDSVTVAVRMAGAPGLHAVAIRTSRGTSAAVTFTVYGLLDIARGRDMGDPQRIPGSVPAVLASTAGGLARVDFRFPGLMTIVDTAESPACLNLLGPSVVPGAVAFVSRAAGQCGMLLARSYGAHPVSVDSGPVAPPSGFAVAAHAGPGRWLVSVPGGVFNPGSVALMVRGSGGAFTTTVFPGIPYQGGFVVSPRGDRVVALAQGLAATVIDPTAGVVTYSLGPEVYSALFSSGGDTLFVGIRDSLVAVDAATGVRLGFSAGVQGGVWAMAQDPGRPWIYTSDGGGFGISVIDSRTGAVVAHLGYGYCECNFDFTLVISQSSRMLYLIAAGPQPGYSYIGRFSLMP